MLRLVAFLPLFVSGLESDSIWPLDYDLFDNGSPSLNEGAVALNPGGLLFDPTLPLDQTPDNTYDSDSFEALFDGSLPPVDSANWDAPFEVANCITSEYMPLIGTSRIRRFDDGTSCKNPTEAPTLPRISPEGASEPTTATDVLTTDDTNSFCFAYTQGILPWGVCAPSGGNAGWTELGGIKYAVYFVNPCTLGTSDRNLIGRLPWIFNSRVLTWLCSLASQATATCPKAEDKVFCCQGVTPEVYPTYAAGLCIPLTSLVSRLPDIIPRRY